MKLEKYEKWWDNKVANESYVTMDSFRKVLDRNESRAEYIGLIEEIRPANVLDVGCGLGLDYVLYKKNFPSLEYHGVDVCKGFIEENKKNFPEADFRWAKAQELPFEDESIDLVTCRGVLEHLKEPETAIKEMARVSSKYVAIIWFLIPQEKEEIKLTQSGFYRNIYSEKRIMDCFKSNKLKLAYTTIVEDNKSPMKKHELWVLVK